MKKNKSNEIILSTEESIILSTNDSNQIIEKIGDLCIKDFKGKTGEYLNRTTIRYTGSDGVSVKIGSRSWAYFKYTFPLTVDEKLYRGVCLPLLGVTAMLHFKNPQSLLNKTKLYREIERLEIKPIKPELKELQTYAGLLTEIDLEKIFQSRAIDFDQRKIIDFAQQFSRMVISSYGGSYIPVFFLENDSLGSEFEESMTNRVFFNQNILNARLEQEVNLENIDLPQSFESLTIELPLLSCEPFYQSFVVYCIKYKERPNHFIIGKVDQNMGSNRVLLDRLNEHQSETNLKPIVVFAFKQISNFESVNPEQFEIDLQMAVASDLVHSGYSPRQDLNAVRNCGPFGFYYNGSEADLMRVCCENGNPDLKKHFKPFSTLEIIMGNKHFQEKD